MEKTGSGNVIFGGSMTAGSNIVVDSAGNVQFSDEVSAGGTIDVESAGYLNMNVGGSLAADGDITLNSGDNVGSYMNLRGITSTNGGIFATNQSGTLTLLSNITVAGDASFTALGGDLIMTNEATVSAAGNLAMTTASNLMMRTNTALSAGGGITLASTNAMFLRTVTSANGDVMATSGGGMVLYSDVTAQAGNIDLDSNWNLSMREGSSLWASNTTTLNSATDMSFRDVTALTGNVAATNKSGNMSIHRAVTAGGEINLHADMLSMQRGSSLSANSNVVLNSGGGMTLYGVTSTNGDVKATSGGNMNFCSNMTAQAGSIDLQSGDRLQTENSDASLSASGTLTAEAATGIWMRDTNSVSAGDVAFRSTSGDIWLNGTTLTSGNNLALETTGDIIVSNNAALSAGGDVFVSAGGDLTAKLSAGGGYYAEAGGTETLDATGTRKDGMQLTFDRLAADGTPDPMVFRGGNWQNPQPVPNPVPPQPAEPSKPKPQPQPEPDPVVPSVMNLQIQRAMAEIPQSQDIAHLRDGVVDEDHLFFLDGTRPHPGPQTGITIQHLKMQEGAITQE